jgi:hypothetical protein
MGKDEGGAGDISDFAWACGNVLEGVPAACEQGKPALAQASQRTLGGVAGAGIDVKFPAVWLFGWDEDAQAGVAR